MVGPVTGATGAAPVLPTAEAGPAAAPGFGAKLDQALEGVNSTVLDGDDALKALASGREVDLHGAMIALQEADIALRAMVTVRDKAVGAYEQLMNLAI
ncbi:MAG: flagellar hook-basal body complex protein FliE [Myxococcota bacterium]